MPRRTLAAAFLSLVVLAATSPTAAHAAAAERKPRSPDGRYEGTEVPEEANGLDDVVFTFDVKKGGRKITKFTIAMNVVCASFPIYVEYVVQPMNPMKVNPRTGRFRDVVTGTTDSGTPYQVEVTGRLKGTTVRDGTMSYDVGICQRGNDPGDPLAWKATRQSKG